MGGGKTTEMSMKNGKFLSLPILRYLHFSSYAPLGYGKFQILCFSLHFMRVCEGLHVLPLPRSSHKHM